MSTRLLRRCLLGVCLAAVVVAPGDAQIPTTFKNLQHFPKDITRDALVQRMREFSLGLGVRCQYCHAGGDGISFEGVVFDSDDKPAKQKARHMLRMVDELNGRLLAAVPARSDPPVRVNCVTCHRGSPIPRTLEDLLASIVAERGAAEAASRYRELRKNAHLGRYNFGEWSLNELASRLHREKNVDAAIAMLRLNAEFYPQSADIDLLLGEALLDKGDKEAAIASFKAALAKQPGNPRAKARLEELSRKF